MDSRIGRREFVALALAAGLAGVAAPWAAPRVLRRLGVHRGPYRGPLLDSVLELGDRLERREISPERYLDGVRERYATLDLRAELAPWLEAVPAREPLRLFEGRLHARDHSLRLALLPPGHAAPPHAHHDLLSVQCVLSGSLHLRQYDRVHRLDAGQIALRPSAERHIARFDTILASERRDNVHWFSAGSEPALVLQFNRVGGLETFETQRAHPGRYYLDPTRAEIEDGLLVTPEIDEEAAHERFAGRPLDAFPQRLPA